MNEESFVSERELVWRAIDARGELGGTFESLCDELGMLVQSINPRLRELIEAGRIVDSGIKRSTRSNRGATVWVTPRHRPVVIERQLDYPVRDPNTPQEFYVGKIDLSQIECRILNTIAGQWDVVEKFRAGVDTYSELASQFYGFPVSKDDNPAERGTGKQLELSCGYGAGGPSIVRTARAGTYGPPVVLSQADGLRARNLYRGTHPCVCDSWQYGGSILYALYHGQELNWPLSPDGVDLQIKDHRIFHPVGGLWLDYSSLERARNEETGEEYWRYRVRDGWRKMYGGRLIENVVQWLASFPIRYRMVTINRECGFRIPLTVHDDVFMLVERSEHGAQKFERAKKIMSQPLAWLPECPINIEGELMDALDK